MDPCGSKKLESSRHALADPAPAEKWVGQNLGWFRRTGQARRYMDELFQHGRPAAMLRLGGFPFRSFLW